MENFFFDDIGSYPLPKGVRREDISLDESYLGLVRDAILQKISAGVEVPNYPQFRDMNRMFLDPIEDPAICDSPYLIRRDSAEIFELSAIDWHLFEPDSQKQIRVCVTGPVELYLAAFGPTRYTDLLYNIAESVARFLEKAILSKKFDVTITSLDEPSLGISPSIVFERDEILEALEIASRPCRKVESEVHLHSPLFAEDCCEVPGINIIGVESAAHPDYLRLIDRSRLVETETYIRCGIARTDLLSMAARLCEDSGRNLWLEPDLLEREILRIENHDLMEDRLNSAYGLFGERLRCAGPDCGLGSWPSQQMAKGLLASCKEAIDSFRRKTGTRPD